MASLQDNLRDLLPTDQKPASAYTKAVRKLLPRGQIWGFVTRTLGDRFKDTITGNAPDYNDNITPGGTLYQDNIYSDLDNKDTSTTFGNFISCFGTELYRFQSAWYNLYTQSIPGLSTELLQDWERNAGLPDSCSINPSSVSLAERQCTVHEKLYAIHQFGLSKPFYINYAASFGYTIVITEAPSNGTPFTVSPGAPNLTLSGTRVGNRIGGGPPVYTTFTITNGSTDPDQIARLQCIIGKLQPAHTKIIWVVNI